MRSGGFHQRVFYSTRYYPKRPNSNHSRENRFPTRKQFVKEVLSSGVSIHSSEPQEIRDSIIELKRVLPSPEKHSKEESALLGIDNCGIEAPVEVNSEDFNKFLRETYPHIARMISEADENISERYKEPNPVEILGYSRHIMDKAQRDKVVQSALALIKGLEELVRSHIRDSTPTIFSPPLVQEEIRERIRVTSHYSCEDLTKCRKYLIRLFKYLQQTPPLFERNIIGDFLRRRLQKLEEWLTEEGYLKKGKKSDPNKPLLSEEDKHFLCDIITYLHITDDKDTAVIAFTRDKNILRAVKAIHDEEPWYGNEPLAGINNLEKFYAATIDPSGRLVYIVGPKQETKADLTTPQQSRYTQNWRLPDYIRRQQQQKLEQLLD